MGVGVLVLEFCVVDVAVAGKECVILLAIVMPPNKLGNIVLT